MALILIIDDSSTTRNAIRNLAKADDHETLEAENGQKGLEIIADQNPDCIILDLIMPEMDGFEVLRTLRKQDSKIPVIILSADIQEIVRKECFELGAKAFINKPLIKRELCNTINKVLGLKKENSNDVDTRSN